MFREIGVLEDQLASNFKFASFHVLDV